MQLLWTTPDGNILSRGAPQRPPFDGAEGAALFAGTCDFDRIDPATGDIVEKHRRRHTDFGRKDGWRLTGHVVEADVLVEILFSVQIEKHHGGTERRELSRTPLLSGLVHRPSPRWRTPDGGMLIQGAPQTTSYGSHPPCDLADALYDYTVVDAGSGEVLLRHCRSDVLIGASDTEILTRHRVEDDALVEYIFDYHEDSCWGVGSVRGHKHKVLIDGLVPMFEG